MRTMISVACAALAVACTAQDKTIHPEPRWMYQDVRQVTSSSNTQVTIGDSVAQKSAGSSTFRISVPDIRKEHFIVSVRGGTAEDLIGDQHDLVMELPKVQQDSVLRRVRQATLDLYTPLFARESKFKVDKTGKLVERMEVEAEKTELRPGLVDAVVAIQTLTRENKRHTAQQVEAHGSRMLDSLYDAYAARRTQIVQLILEPYTFNLPESGSARQPTVLKDLRVPVLEGVSELPATQEMGLDELTEKTLVARVVTTADPDAVVKAMLARDPKTPLKKMDVSVIKESVYTVDRSTGWCTQITTEWRVRVGKKKARVQNTSVYEAVTP
jgi:hypothetical protein